MNEPVQLASRIHLGAIPFTKMKKKFFLKILFGKIFSKNVGENQLKVFEYDSTIEEELETMCGGNFVKHSAINLVKYHNLPCAIYEIPQHLTFNHLAMQLRKPSPFKKTFQEK